MRIIFFIYNKITAYFITYIANIYIYSTLYIIISNIRLYIEILEISVSKIFI